MIITASQVAELRKKTDCGMMECKKALEEAEGNLELAVEILRKKGMAKAAKKADRVASEGLIFIKKAENSQYAIMLEINSETDFVARDSNFQHFVSAVADIALQNQARTVEQLLELSFNVGEKIEVARQALISKVGENITIRRIAFIETTGLIGVYVHGNRIGVLVAVQGGTEELAKDLAMHIAASKPQVVLPEQVDESVIEKEKEISKAQLLDSGKPAHIMDKIVDGRVKKFLNEVSLVGQPFVKNLDITVGQLLSNEKAQVECFIRFELGEGIEKKTTDFVSEVMSQVKGS